MANIQYRVMKPEDRDGTRELFYAFWRGEPLAMGLNMEVPRECKRFVDEALEEAVRNGLSIVAVDKSNGKIIAIGACAVVTPGNEKNWSAPPGDKDCEKMNKEWEILNKLYEGLDLFKMYGVEKIAKIKGLATDENYRGQGIGNKLVQNWCDILKENGVGLFVDEATSHFSRRIFEKLGFGFLKELKYEGYIADGTLNMPSDSPHKMMTLVVKHLSKT